MCVCVCHKEDWVWCEQECSALIRKEPRKTRVIQPRLQGCSSPARLGGGGSNQPRPLHQIPPTNTTPTSRLDFTKTKRQKPSRRRTIRHQPSVSHGGISPDTFSLFSFSRFFFFLPQPKTFFLLLESLSDMYGAE